MSAAALPSPSPPQVTKKLWAYLKEKNLQDPDNKQWFTPDDTMAGIFGTEKIKCFSMAKYLERHFSAAVEEPEAVGFIRPVCCRSADKINEQYGGVEGQLPLAGPPTWGSKGRLPLHFFRC